MLTNGFNCPQKEEGGKIEREDQEICISFKSNCQLLPSDPSKPLMMGTRVNYARCQKPWIMVTHNCAQG